jgi:hypothetical protein
LTGSSKKTAPSRSSHGSVSLGGDPVDFVYSEVFTFTGGLVSRLDTFHIWLGERPE